MPDAAASISVRFHWRDVPLRQINRHIASRLAGSRTPSPGIVQRLTRVLLWGLFFLALILLARTLVERFAVSEPVAARRAVSLVLLGLLIGLSTAATVLCGLNLRLERRGIAAVLDAPSRAGDVEITLSQDGVVTSAKGATTLLSWQNIVAVEQVEQTTLIKPSRAEYLPIPHQSLPPDMKPDRLHAAIAEWRGASAPVP